MTAPASIPLSRTEPRAPARDAIPAAANADAEQGKTPDFAAILALQAAPAGEPVRLANDPLATTTPPADAATAEEAPGKTLPAIQQSLAAPLAALRLLITAEDKADPAKAAAEPSTAAGDQTDAGLPADPAPAPFVLPIAVPVAVQTPSAPPQAATPPDSRTASARSGATTATTTAGRTEEPASPPTATSTPQAAQPAAFAVAHLVLEREAVAPAREPAVASEAAPQAQPAALQDAARTQPSTLAALTGAPERPGNRKLRGESEAALPAAKLAILPDTAGALALAQPASPPAAAPQQTPAATAPQQLSFDQLVDSIARARDGAEQGGPVAVAMHHGEFGRISLRIESDATGLSVAMASPDPAFAPAVAAAHAAAVAEPARSAANGQQPGSPEQSLTQGQSGSNSGPGTSQQRQPPATRQPAANPAGSPAPRSERRGGIFA